MKTTYTFSGDSGIRTIEAGSANEAAAIYRPGCETMDDVVESVESAGGYLSIEEDGLVIARVAP